MADEIALPPRLSKYRSMNPTSRDFTADIFRKNQVWYARASSFNDPFDCDHFIDVDRTLEEWREIMEQFEQRFAQGLALVPGLLVQHLWNAFAEHVNRKQAGESGRKLPTLSKEKLAAVTRRIGEKSVVTFGGRTPRELVDEPSVGAEGLNELLNRYFDESKRAIDERFGVFSLAEQPDNILMWSHYADEHAGICIEFDTESYPGAFRNLHAVEYKQESPVIEKRFANILMNLQDKEPSSDQAFLARIARKDVEAEWTDREIRSWFLTKSTLWQYEQEWRSIVPGPGLKRVPAAAISGVVIGYKADQATEDAVRDWVRRRRRKVSISRAVKRKGAFALDLVDVQEAS